MEECEHLFAFLDDLYIVCCHPTTPFCLVSWHECIDIDMLLEDLKKVARAAEARGGHISDCVPAVPRCGPLVLSLATRTPSTLWHPGLSTVRSAPVGHTLVAEFQLRSRLESCERWYNSSCKML